MPPIDLAPSPSIPGCILDHEGILATLPHRYPFLLLDRVVEFEIGKRAAGFKNVSFGEPYFQGHFPSEPVMPGVLQVEAMAQLATILMSLSFDEFQGKRPALMGLDRTRFRRPVRPGDQLRLEAELISLRRGVGTVQGTAMVEGQVASEVQILAMFV